MQSLCNISGHIAAGARKMRGAVGLIGFVWVCLWCAMVRGEGMSETLMPRGEKVRLGARGGMCTHLEDACQA